MPESRDLRQKAGHLFDKIVSAYHESKPSAPKPPPKPPGYSVPPIFEPGATSNPIDHLAGAFHGLSISNPSTPATVQTDPGFVGGFNLAGASSSAPALGSPSRPPAMPVPFVPYPGQQSLTMQFALRPDSSDLVSIPLPPFKPQGSSGQHSSPSSPILGPSTSVGLSPSTSPTRPSILSTPTKHRTNSSISSASRTSTPSGKTSQTRCAGITKAGKRCTRQVKTDLADDDAEDEEENVPRFCFQHTTEILVPSGYYARKDGAWVTFKEWIPAYLQPSTQASLRAEMEKVKSARDVPGYIYTFEIRDPKAPKTIKLKVGRAVNLVKRIDQWGKQCGSKEQVLRGFFPGNVEEDGSSLMKGRVQAGEKAPWCHRLERLVHIELADLASTCVYLEPGWPKIESPPAPSTPSKAKTNGPGNGCTASCPDCGSLHREIFEFRRWGKGGNQGKEWEKVVKPVIEKWGRFVNECV